MRWTKPSVNEALATLYLRLNGYFTTGLSLHSPAWGESRTEVDCVAIRHPKHSQSERGVECSTFAVSPSDRSVIRRGQRWANADFVRCCVVRLLRFSALISVVLLEPKYSALLMSASIHPLSVILA